MKYDLTILEDGCKQFNIMLTDKQRHQFIQYFEILVEWNRVMNLTAITEFQEVLLKHFVDSLSISGILNINDISDMIDVGTGAGFPGIPLKIAFPHLRITLLDSLKKRINFLDEVIEQLQLAHVEVIQGRAEEYARQKNYRETYDLCVSRAVANLSTLSEYCLPYIKEDGYFVSYKSGKIEEELAESEKSLSTLGGRLKKVHKFQLGNTDMSRSLLVIMKEHKTPSKYPRKAGTPAKDPIK